MTYDRALVNMKISYDKQVDALYIRLLAGEFECRTVRLSDSVTLNIGSAEELVGIEILDARRTLDLDPEPHIDIENLQARLAG